MLNFAAHATPSPKLHGLARRNDGYFYGPTGLRVPVDSGARLVVNCGSAMGAHGNADWAFACGTQAAAQAAAVSANQASYCKASGLKGASGFGFSC